MKADRRDRTDLLCAEFRPGRAARERARNSATASKPSSSSSDGRCSGQGKASDGTRQVTSPGTPRLSLLVASTATPGHDPSTFASAAQAPRRYSQLSSTTSRRWGRRTRTSRSPRSAPARSSTPRAPRPPHPAATPDRAPHSDPPDRPRRRRLAPRQPPRSPAGSYPPPRHPPASPDEEPPPARPHQPDHAHDRRTPSAAPGGHRPAREPRIKRRPATTPFTRPCPSHTSSGPAAPAQVKRSSVDDAFRQSGTGNDPPHSPGRIPTATAWSHPSPVTGRTPELPLRAPLPEQREEFPAHKLGNSSRRRRVPAAKTARQA